MSFKSNSYDNVKQAVHVATRYAPAPVPMGAPAPCTPPSRHNMAVVSHAQYILTVTAAPASCVKAAVSKAAWLTLTFDLESSVRVTCDVGYLCTNFGLPRPLCSRVIPDVHDRKTDVRQWYGMVWYTRV